LACEMTQSVYYSHCFYHRPRHHFSGTIAWDPDHHPTWIDLLYWFRAWALSCARSRSL